MCSSAMQFEVQLAEDGSRLDTFLAEHVAELSRSAVQQLIVENHVTVDGRPVAKNTRLKTGSIVHCTVPPPIETQISAQHIPLDVYYEDADLLVVNKPKGMVVHPAPGNYDGTLVNALLWHCKDSLSGVGGELRPGIVHRIDKDTSGLLVVAKNDFAHAGLAKQLADHSMTRVYQAVVYGGLKEDTGMVDASIGRSERDRKKMAVTQKHAKTAVTTYRVVARYHGFTHIELRLKTGRTHQIRVHMASIGHPVAGDAVYGPKNVITALGGQCLHAGTLGFLHPRTGAYLEFTAPLPQYFTNFLQKLQREENV